jgi:hypothetical protein
MKGLFTINSADELDILSSSLSDDNKSLSLSGSELKRNSELSTEDPYTSSSDLELENLITSNNVMIQTLINQASQKCKTI